MDKVAEQEVQVSQFIEENREVLEDPQVGYGAICRLCAHAGDVYKAVTDEATRAANTLREAAPLLTDALNDEERPAGEVNKLEKEYKRLEVEHERMAVIQAQIDAFLTKAQARRTGEFEEDGTPKVPAPEAEKMAQAGEILGETIAQGIQQKLAERPEVPKPVAWWQRLLGLGPNYPDFSGAPMWASEPPESTLTPSQADSGREDYEKILIWYEQNLEVLEKAVAGRERGEPGDWQQVIDELLGSTSWCYRNMDAIEQRNAEIAGSGLVTKRRDLFAQYLEISS